MTQMFRFRKFDRVEVPDMFSSSKDYDVIYGGGTLARQTHVHGLEDWGDSGIIFHQNDTLHQEQQQHFTGFGGFNNLCSEVFSPFQLSDDELIQLTGVQSEILNVISAQQVTSSPASFEILSNSRRKSSQWNRKKFREAASSRSSEQALSTTEIIRLAGKKFIQSNSLNINDPLEHTFPSSTITIDHFDDKVRDVEVIQHLLAFAEKVDEEQLDLATKLFDQCDEYTSAGGNPIQRLVYYFSKALRERIDLKNGKSSSRDMKKMKSINITEAIRCQNPTFLSFYEQVPFSQVVHFTGIQAILESVREAKRIHIVDLEIGTGVQFSVFIQALASRCECPVEYLKITAVGTKSKSKIEKTGMWLKAFAQSMNLSLCFNIVMVEDMLDLNESLFELNDNEVLAVYSPFFLWTMIGEQYRLENLMKVIRSINPCVMVIAEIEANINSTVFGNRFIEALFYYGAYFDCMENCLSHDEATRNITESTYCGPGICNILMAEKEERIIRHVKINVWQTFFARFNMIQIDLSLFSLHQASLVTSTFACGSSCSLDMDGKSLIVGWKGTPLISLSVWKFI